VLLLIHCVAVDQETQRKIVLPVRPFSPDCSLSIDFTADDIAAWRNGKWIGINSSEFIKE
jgi:hypothetical protein